MSRKHVCEKGRPFCDCGKVVVTQTVTRNAYVVTLMLDADRERLVRALADARHALEHYGECRPYCSSSVTPSAPCDCGALAALARVDAELGKEGNDG